RDPAGTPALAQQRERDPGPVAHRLVPRGRPRSCPARPGPGDRPGAGRQVDDVESLLAVVEHGIPQADGRAYHPSVGRRASIMTNLRACLALCRADLARARGDLQREAAFARAALAGT